MLPDGRTGPPTVVTSTSSIAWRQDFQSALAESAWGLNLCQQSEARIGTWTVLKFGDWMLIASLFLAALVGLSLGLLGGGGSILTVPILVYVAGFPAKASINLSLPALAFKKW